jgi:glycosyltransferase involved in cell wall biosynthesis
MNDILISVIICTYNRDTLLPLALKGLKEQVFPNSNWELVIIDNNCTDGTAALCRSFKNENPHLCINYQLEKKQGLSNARNRGINESQGKYVAFIDDDAVATPDYLKQVKLFFEQYVDANLVGGRIYPRFETEKPSWVTPFLMPLFSVLDLGNEVKKLDGKVYPVGANMIFRKDVFIKCGGFKPELGRTGKNMMGGEEKDMYLRIGTLPGSIYYAPGPMVYHIIPADRATEAFIHKQAIGVGMSERTRVIGKPLEQLASYTRELMKWGASFSLALFYVLTFHVSKAQMILKFRMWVTTGMFTKPD